MSASIRLEIIGLDQKHATMEILGVDQKLSRSCSVQGILTLRERYGKKNPVKKKNPGNNA